MVLCIFVGMMQNIGEVVVIREQQWLTPRSWIGLGTLFVFLLVLRVWAEVEMAGTPRGAAQNKAGPIDVKRLRP